MKRTSLILSSVFVALGLINILLLWAAASHHSSVAWGSAIVIAINLPLAAYYGYLAGSDR